MVSAALARYRPDLVPSDLDMLLTVGWLEAPHAEYTTHVSPEQMAVSVNTAAYAAWLAGEVPGPMCDMGSGFTSYALRAVTQDVWSFDDSAEWLAWTGQFLERYGLNTDRLLIFDPACTERFGLIVYDFGSGETREQWMPWAFDHLAPGGMILFDDAQHHTHQPRMRELCEERRYDLYDLQAWTKDRFGRFAALAVSPSV